MSVNDPFGDVTPEHEHVLGNVANFWSILNVLLLNLIEREPRESLGHIVRKAQAQVEEMFGWFDKEDTRKVTITEFYRILFYMRDNTLPLVVELEQVANDMGVDLMVPIRDNGGITAITLTEWLDSRVINLL